MEHFGLKEADLNAMRAVLAQFPSVSKAVIYGSRAKGNFRPGSDIDLVLLGEDLSLVTQYAIETAFDELQLPY
jgi:predicted nucleotidyltransferase